MSLMADAISEPPIFVNGRFFVQPVTGVQRVAREMTSALRAQYGSRLRVVGPARSMRQEAEGVAPVGCTSGQIWEQVDLPRYARGGVLLNFGNTAPLLHRRQLVIIHDAGIFETPKAYSWKFRLWYRVLQGLMARGGAKIVTVSEFSKSDLVRNLGLSASRVHVVRPGSDHMGRQSADAGILARHSLHPGSFVLVVGTLAAHKNISALNILAKMLEARGVPFVIAGGVGGAAFSAASAELPQPARYLGRVTDAELKALYESAACFIVPSLYEGFGLPAVEAMTCGCPVVAADIPALRESCGAAALFCDPRAPEQIAAVVLTLLDDAPLRERMRKAALQHSGEMTWKKSAASLAAIIETL